MKHFTNWPLAGIDPRYGRIKVLILFLLFIAPMTALGQTEEQSATRSSHTPSRSHAEAAAASRGTVMQIATSPALPNVIVISLTSPDSPLRYSLDGGHTWQRIATPWGQTIPNIAVAPRSDGSVRILAAGGEGLNAALYRTGDFGATWSAQTFPGLWGGLTTSSADPRRLYVSGDTGWYETQPGCWPLPCDARYGYVYTSNDAGVTWTPLLSRFLAQFGDITPSPVISTTTYVHEVAGGGVNNWFELPNEDELQFPIDTLALDSVDPARLYGGVFDYTYPYSVTMSIGKTSINRGKDWSSWPNTPPGCIQLMAHPTKSGFLYLRCSQGLYRSSDSGTHWEQISPVEGDLLAPNYGIPGQLLWAREDGLWVSNDDGGRWLQLTAGWAFHLLYLPSVVR